MFPRPSTYTLVAALILAASSAFATPTDDAIALFNEKKFPDARAALEKIVAAEPTNATATHYLGQTLLRRGDPKAYDEGVPLLEKAATLDPKNARYLVAYGQASMQLASNNTSISAATKGRDALEKSLALDPDNLDARETLFQFYHRAPWPIGSSSKANAQLAEIRKRDADRGITLDIIAKTNAKDFAAAFKLCDEIIAKNPDDYTAHYQYGRTAAISDLNLSNGVAHLEKCLTLTPPKPTSPTHSHAWNRLGNLHEKLKHPAEARAAYESALKLDPTNKPAADALARLK
jgi:tetratricopeptide (TPR) repeat protein